MRFLFSLFLLLYTLSASAFLSKQPDFLPVEEAFQLTLTATQQADQGLLNWEIEPGYYLYRHSIEASDAQAKAIDIKIPTGIENEDEFFGLTEIYRYNLQVPISLEHPQPLQVTWQGCADAGLCYPPQTSKLQLGTSSNDSLATDQGIAERLANASLPMNIAAFFVMGLLLAFTPCMLPMLPILSSVIAGSRPGGWQGARLGSAFVIAMSLVYAALGILAAQLGSNLSATLQNAWLLIPFASLFVLLALAQFGLFTLQLPAFIRNKLQSKDQKIQGGSLLGAAALGMFSALLVGPCMTAPLAGALLFISQSGNSTTGGLALFSLGIGSGLPLLLAMSFGMRWLPKPGEWMQRVSRIFAYALLAAAIFILLPIIHTTLAMILWGIWLMAIALELGYLKYFITRLGAILLSIYAAMILLGAATGGHNPLSPLNHFNPVQNQAYSPLQTQRLSNPDDVDRQLQLAQQAGQWVILDFYADWCISCKVMERTVFGQSAVQNAISDMRFIQPDVTDNNLAQRQLLQRYNIMGPPTILFIAPDGSEMRNARITGEVDAKGFLQHLQQARAGN